MLVWMTVMHLPTRASAIFNQPFGCVSSAEGFVFLAALFTGFTFFRIAQREGYRNMCKRAWSRSARLYGCHVFLVGVAFLVALLPIGGNRSGLHNLLDFYFAAGPQRAAIDAALLIYRPPLLDILPMYILFLALTPVALIVAVRLGWKVVFSAGFGLWLLAQFGLRHAVYQLMTKAGLQIALNQMGAFDLWAWQLLWLLGMWLGVRWAKGDLPFEAWAKRATIPALLIAFVLLTLRHVVGCGIEAGPFGILFNKWHLGIVRLIDLAAVSILLVRFQSLIKFVTVRPLVMLGQASLPVFCMHLLSCLFGILIMNEASVVSGWAAASLLVSTFGALFLVAKVIADNRPQIGKFYAARGVRARKPALDAAQ
jgi:hypothetical protein